jgi:hypothetical protein
VTATKKPKKRPKKAVLLPATGSPSDAAHVSRAVQGCRCPQCATHRLEERRAERDQRVIERYANEPMIGEATWFEHNVNGRQR